MALSDNIKNSEEKKSHSATTCRQVICFKADSLPLGKWFEMSRFDYGKKLALELDVSMDELISDEDVNDIQVNYGIWKSERIQNRIHLQELRKNYWALWRFWALYLWRLFCFSYSVREGYTGMAYY